MTANPMPDDALAAARAEYEENKARYVSADIADALIRQLEAECGAQAARIRALEVERDAVASERQMDSGRFQQRFYNWLKEYRRVLRVHEVDEGAILEAESNSNAVLQLTIDAQERAMRTVMPSDSAPE